VADSEPSKRPKRRLKAPTQTVRERAEQAQQTADRPARNRHVKTAASAAGRPIRGIGRVFQRQPFHFIGVVLRPIGRILFPRYFREAYLELRLVEWPNRKTSRQLTYAVLAFAVVFGAVIATVDYGLDKVFRTLLLK
jgi:preprotein translocase SecE subunit